MNSPAPLPNVSVPYQVAYADTDMMGVVYYGNYLTLFERCRNELMRLSEVSYKEMEAQGAMLPVIEAHVNYIKSAKYDDTLNLIGWVESAGGVRAKICYQVMRGNDLLATGHTVHVCVSAETRKPIRMPAYLCKLVASPTRVPLFEKKAEHA